MNILQRALGMARDAEWVTYRHWVEWKDSEFAETRQLALKAKCHGLVAFDRIMRTVHGIKP